MITRFHTNKLEKLIVPNKVLIIYGPRRVGKTTMVNNYIDQLNGLGKVFASTGEDSVIQEVLESNNVQKITSFFGGYNLIVIDEAQKIENIGQGLKLLVDQIPEIKVIATGSSSFDLSNKVGEPLVGRKKTIKLFPLSVIELQEHYGSAYTQTNLEHLLLFGSYPEVITSSNIQSNIDYLTEIRDSYLYKDILELEDIKNSRKILGLLRLIAFQIGNEVSHHELGTKLGMSKNTVDRYLDLLEKAFVIVNVRGYSRNLRKEINKTSRYYFLDNGIRNAVIGNFNFINSRNDMGQLWENFLFIERLKKQEYKKIHSNNYFWRTYDQKEIDMVRGEGWKVIWL